MKLKFTFLTIVGCLVLSNIQAQISPLEKADKQFELNNFEGSIKSYTQALETTEDKTAIYTRLGDACQKLGRTNEALQWYEKAAVKGDESVQLKLGKACISLAKYQQAKEVLKKLGMKNIEAKHFLENCDFALSALPPSMFEVSNATALNTASDDFLASFTTNGSIVFLSTRTDMARKAGKMPAGANQLFSSTYSNTEFSKPEFFNSDLKNIFGEGPLSEHGFQAIITQNNFIAGIRPLEVLGLELSLKKANINPDGHWKTTQSVQLGGAGYSNAFASFNDDGTSMVFSSNRPGGQGGFDLYLCKKEGDDWGAPINMGELNSPGNEITPFFSGGSLFFSSDYLKGLGGFDIFRAEQTNGIFNEIFHLGNQVNSAADDYGFIFDPQKGFGLFNSNREGGNGGEDLYVAHRYATDLSFVFLDEEANPIADVKIDPSKCGYESGLSDSKGKISLQMAGEGECAISFYKTGFIPLTETYKGNKGVEPLSYVITLKKAPVPYFGFVQDEDGLALEGVMVKATNTASQLKFDAVTDSKGRYTLPLEAKNDYLIYFSKAKFINLNINKKNLNASELGLGTVKLRMTMADNEVVDEPKSKTAAPEEKYTLQIASVSDKNTDLSAYKKALGSFGEVYMSPGANGTFKIKVGKYSTREEAVKAYEGVKKAGYQPIISTAIGSSIPQNEKQVPNEMLKPDETVYSNYAVRLCTLSKPENFNGSKIENLGKLVSMKNGTLTIFLLINFKDLEAAQIARDKVQKAGFKDAYVVERQAKDLLKVD